MSRKRANRNRRKNRQGQPAEGGSNANLPDAGGQPNQPAQRIQTTISAELSYSGPIPPPALLKQYEEIVPGAAERIIAQAERQTDHRIGLERMVVTSDVRRSWAGLITGGLLAFFTIGSGVFLVHTGHDGAGATIATVGLASLVGVFVYGTQKQRKERVEKAEMMTGKTPGKK